MNERLAELLDAVRDDLLVARVAAERDDLSEVARLLRQAGDRLQVAVDVLTAEAGAPR